MDTTHPAPSRPPISDPAAFVADLVRVAFADDLPKSVCRAAALVAVEVFRREGLTLAAVVGRLAGKDGAR